MSVKRSTILSIYYLSCFWKIHATQLRVSLSTLSILLLNFLNSLNSPAASNQGSGREAAECRGKKPWNEPRHVPTSLILGTWINLPFNTARCYHGNSDNTWHGTWGETGSRGVKLGKSSYLYHLTFLIHTGTFSVVSKQLSTDHLVTTVTNSQVALLTTFNTNSFKKVRLCDHEDVLSIPAGPLKDARFSATLPQSSLIPEYQYRLYRLYPVIHTSTARLSTFIHW